MQGVYTINYEDGPGGVVSDATRLNVRHNVQVGGSVNVKSWNSRDKQTYTGTSNGMRMKVKTFDKKKILWDGDGNQSARSGAVSFSPFKQRISTLRRTRNETRYPACRWLLWWCSEATGS
jgi:hypothetical protein